MDDARAVRFAEGWYAAWNEHDLDAIVEHYAEDVPRRERQGHAFFAHYGVAEAGYRNLGDDTQEAR